MSSLKYNYSNCNIILCPGYWLSLYSEDLFLNFRDEWQDNDLTRQPLITGRVL